MDLEPAENNDLSNHQVSQSNSLLTASQKLTLNEKRLVMAAISKLNPKKALPKQGIRVYASEMSETFGMDDKSAYRELQQAGRRLIRRIWTIKGRSPVNGKPSVIERHWVIEAEYQEGEGWVSIVFHPKTEPFLSALAGNYTKYRLGSASALRSLYSWRMLENMHRYGKAGENGVERGIWSVYIDDFHEIMDTPPSLRDNFARLRKRVIDTAMKELKKDWKIRLTTKKRGRRIATLIFEFEQEKQPDLFSPREG